MYGVLKSGRLNACIVVLQIENLRGIPEAIQEMITFFNIITNIVTGFWESFKYGT